MAETADQAIAARRAELLAEVQLERQAKIDAARSKEETRLSEARELKDLVRENERKVAEESKRRADEERRRKREREDELERVRVEQRRRLEAAASSSSV